MRPKWTVLYNIVSKESDTWVGTGWEFFDTEEQAQLCYNRQIAQGNCPCKRLYHKNDVVHLAAIHAFKPLKQTCSKEIE